MALRFPYRLAAAAALGLSSMAVAAPPAKPAKVSVNADQQMADTIAGKLAQSPTLSGYHVDVTCVSGSVELKGTVRNEEQRGEVMKLVRTTSGVKKIKDQMTIKDTVTTTNNTVNTVEPAQALEMAPPPAAPPGVFGGSPPMSFPGQAYPGPQSYPRGGPPPMGFSGPVSPGPQGYAGPPGYSNGGPPPMNFQGQVLPVPPTPVPNGGPAGGGYGIDPTPMNVPLTGGLYDSSAPKMPPYAWPTYAPYSNYSRVGYPTEYPAEAFPFIGPMYPFPKVPLGFRAIKLEWEDGHWYYGRNGTMRDMWKIRYW